MELEEDQIIIPCSHKTAGDFFYESAYAEDAQRHCYALTQNPPSMLR